MPDRHCLPAPSPSKAIDPVGRLSKRGHITLRLAHSLPMLAVAGTIVYLIANNSGPAFRALLVHSTTIDQLLQRPGQYDGRIVKVDGVVAGSFGIMGLGGFRLTDPESGREVLVMTSNGIPPVGNSATAFGRFKQALSIGSRQYAVIFINF
jgi:hypothetical protein